MYGTVIKKSLWKAFKRTGTTVGMALAVALVAVLEDPATAVPLAQELGPWGPLAAIGMSLTAQAIADAIKHRPRPAAHDMDDYRPL